MPENEKNNHDHALNLHVTALRTAAKLTQDELQYLWSHLAAEPNLALFNADLKDSNLHTPILKFDDDTFVSMGKKVGEGVWSDVFEGYCYQKSAPQREPESMIIKRGKNLAVLSGVYRIHDRMEIECKMLRIMHGEKNKIVHLTVNGVTTTYLLMKRLGEISCKDILKKPDWLSGIWMKQISLDSWLNFFEQYLTELAEIHQRTGYIHNDIKPANMMFTPNGEAHFIDLGNMEKNNSPGVFGDWQYAPTESLTIGLFTRIKDQRTDIFSLGKTFLQLIHKLKEILPEFNNMWDDCKKIFAPMCSFLHFKRPDLASCIQQIQILRLHYQDHENEIGLVDHTPRCLPCLR